MSIATEIQRLQTAKADIKTAIEEKGVEVGNGLIDTYAEKIKEITGGGGDVIDFARYAKTITFASLNIFGKSEVVLNLDSATQLNMLFRITTAAESANKNTTVEHLTINCPNLITQTAYMLSVNYSVKDEMLKRVTLNVDTSKCTNFNCAFEYCVALEIIDGFPLDFSSATMATNPLHNCLKLIEFRVVENSIKISFNAQHCSNLSAETIQSIINGLADLTGQTTQTVTFYSTVGAKLTDEQKATITAKNWTLAY